MSQEIDESHRAMLRGVKNCGRHHEENELAPAIQFAQGCDLCAALIFMTIYNAGAQAQLREALRIVQVRGKDEEVD